MTALLLTVSLLLQAPTGGVSGVIKTPEGNPISGVRVSVQPITEVRDAPGKVSIANIGITDDQGRFALAGIPAGRYYIAAGRIDGPTYYPGTLDLKSATIVSITAGATISGMDFKLADASVLRAGAPLQSVEVPLQIRVEGGGKVPISSGGNVARIRFERPGTTSGNIGSAFGEPNILVRTGEEMEVHVDSLPEGYTVQSMTYGSRDLLKERLNLPPVHFSIVNGRNVLTPYASPQAITIVLRASPRPAPPSGVQVTGQALSEPLLALDLSGVPGTYYRDGSFEFLGIKPGRHILAGVAPDRAFGAFVIVGDRDVRGIELRDVAGPLPSRPRDSESAGTLTPGSVLPLASVNGIVRDEVSRRPAGEGTLKITGYNRQNQNVFVDDQGRFTLPRLFPGIYTVEIDIPGHEPLKRDLTVGTENITLELSTRRLP
jgi:hypothetical protein